MDDKVPANEAVNVHEDSLTTPAAPAVDWQGKGSLRYRPYSRLLVVSGMPAGPDSRGISFFIWEHFRMKRVRFVSVR